MDGCMNGLEGVSMEVDVGRDGRPNLDEVVERGGVRGELLRSEDALL